MQSLRTGPPLSLLLLLPLAILLAATAASGRADDRAGRPAVRPPQVLDPSLQIELIASEPELVTPVGCRFDDRGRLFVIESHTHFPPEGYEGLPHDRILLVDDSTGDGTLDRLRTFYEGTEATMGLAWGPDGWLYLATRAMIARLRDTTGDDRADQFEELVRLETSATYPHNGLSGLVFDVDGSLLFGMGENFGAPYTLAGADGSQLVGGGEGGNVYRCTPEGGDLQWVATGFWNPFGLAIDPHGRLLAVCNDPDAMPPCRIVHVVPGGDYGFQFRFGRAGTHPLQSWNGELPGTLPFVAGTGEAPCAVLPFRGQLWVTSWGDNRIERYTLQSDGATLRGTPDVPVVGDAMFRPVDMAVAPDGSLYVTDWVDRSYPVHGKGRLWRIRFDESDDDALAEIPPLSDAEQTALQLQRGQTPPRQLLSALASDDRYLWQAATYGLATSDQLEALDVDGLEDARQRLGWLMAWRWRDLIEAGIEASERRQRIARGLADEDESVRLSAVRWAAERQESELTEPVAQQLERAELSPAMLGATVAALSYLESGKVERAGRDPANEQRLAQIVTDTRRGPSLRAGALRLLPPQSDHLSLDQLVGWARGAEPAVAREAARHLVARSDGGDRPQRLADLAADSQVAPAVRADALVGLSAAGEAHTGLLASLAKDAEEEVATTAQRITSPRQADDRASAEDLPPANDLEAWMELVGEGGDADAGWRVFFGHRDARCAACHTHQGRGAALGPDLSTIGGTMSRQRLLESILQPSKEIGPMYVPWQILTVDGRALTGMKLNAGGVGTRQRYLAADGTVFEVELAEIETQTEAPRSIMPEELEQQLGVESLRDLLAFLEASAE